MSKHTVAHISTVHSWDDSRIFARMCKSIARCDYDVTLLAVGDHDVEQDNVKIKTLKRARSRVTRVLTALPLAGYHALSFRADLYHLHDPELIPLIPLLKIRGARVIYDAHEDLPRQVLQKDYLPTWAKPLVGRLANVLCWFVNRTADHIITATPTIAESFSATICTTIHNYGEAGDRVRTADDGAERRKTIVYAGGLNEVRGIPQMVRAMERADIGHDWRLVLAGSPTPADLMDRLRELPGWARVDYLGSVPVPEADELLRSASIGLVVYQPTQAHLDAMPTKLFEFMAAGVPIVYSGFERWRGMVDEIGCGLAVNPTSPDAIGGAIAELASDPVRARMMGERGRVAAHQRFNWATEEKRLLAVYTRVLRGGRSVSDFDESDRMKIGQDQ